MQKDKRMDQDISYLTLEQILVIHENQIDNYGGSHGLRDLALLESAVFRPQSTFSGEDLYPTIFDKAAALIHSLIQNHPFIDGNKRTATASTIVFLINNGYELQVDNDAIVKVVLEIAEKKITLQNLSVWLKDNTIPLSN